MEALVNKEDKARMELRISASDKELFEYAKQLSGIPTLAEFVRRVVREKAESIVEEHERILSSKRDQKVFFDALMNPPMPSKSLKDAIDFYHSEVAQ